MIYAEFFTKQNKLLGFEISGHAGFDDNGRDIVCASVSSATQLTVNTITEIFNIKGSAKVLGDKIQFRVSSYDDTAGRIIEGLKLHLTLLSEDYKGTIKITTSEV